MLYMPSESAHLHLTQVRYLPVVRGEDFFPWYRGKGGSGGGGGDSHLKMVPALLAQHPMRAGLLIPRSVVGKVGSV